MNLLKTIILLLLISCSSFSQVKITGNVNDISHSAIEYANIKLTNQKEEIVINVVTNENGQYKFLVKKGIYQLTASYIGYYDIKKQVNIKGEEKFDIIILKKSENQLDEVIVSKQKKMIQQKADRYIFNVEDSFASSGGDALEVLKITPGIQVKNDGITIIGKQEVRVMIDDRMIMLTGEELIAYLTSISSDDIKKIEVITTPPSKYDAEGNSGLINIQLKKAKEGSWNNNMRIGYIQTSYPAASFGNTFTYNSGKTQMIATINGKKGDEGQTITSNIDYPSGPWIGKLKSKNQQDYISGRVGFDYSISKKNSIGILYSGTTSNKDNRDNDHISIFDISNNQTGSIASVGNNIKEGENHSINAHYIRKIDTLGRKLSVDLDYFNYLDNQNRIFDSDRSGEINSYFKASNISDQDINNYSAKIDFEHPLSWGNLSYGAKVSFIETDNIITFNDLTSGTSIFDPSQSDNFRYDENTQALYLDYTKSFGEKWQIKVGLRLENTQTTGLSKTFSEENKRDYTKLFPTLYINYLKNENNTINFSYSRRIKRPGYWELNPFRWYTNTNSYVEGNPFLRPEISDNFEIKHIFKNKLISKAFLTFSNDGFGQIPSVNPITNQQIYTRANYYKTFVLGLDETFIYNPFKWWNIISQAAIFTMSPSYIDGVDLNTPILGGASFIFYSNHTLFLKEDKTIQGNITFRYQSPQKMLVFESSSYSTLNLGLKFLFLDSKLQCSVTVNDIFKSLAPNVISNTNNIKQVYNNYYDNRYLNIGLSYKFGNQKIRVADRTFGNEEEKKRTN